MVIFRTMHSWLRLGEIASIIDVQMVFFEDVCYVDTKIVYFSDCGKRFLPIIYSYREKRQRGPLRYVYDT